jgi:hypothetical protein
MKKEKQSRKESLIIHMPLLLSVKMEHKVLQGFTKQVF